MQKVYRGYLRLGGGAAYRALVQKWGSSVLTGF